MAVGRHFPPLSQTHAPTAAAAVSHLSSWLTGSDQVWDFPAKGSTQPPHRNVPQKSLVLTRGAGPACLCSVLWEAWLGHAASVKMRNAGTSPRLQGLPQILGCVFAVFFSMRIPHVGSGSFLDHVPSWRTALWRHREGPHRMRPTGQGGPVGRPTRLVPLGLQATSGRGKQYQVTHILGVGDTVLCLGDPWKGVKAPQNMFVALC